MKIILVRHGQKQKIDSKDSSIKRSVLLTPKGIEQIKGTAGYLSRQYPKLQGTSEIFSSQIPRAVQSTEIIRNILQISEIKPRKELNEYYAYDDYSIPKNKRDKMQLRLMNELDYVSPDTNMSMNMYIERTKEFFHEQNEKGKEIILCICHGGLIRHNVYKIDEARRPVKIKIWGSLIREGSITEINYQDGDMKVNYFDKRV